MRIVQNWFSEFRDARQRALKDENRCVAEKPILCYQEIQKCIALSRLALWSVLADSPHVP
jgi:hypothetical protein